MQLGGAQERFQIFAPPQEDVMRGIIEAQKRHFLELVALCQSGVWGQIVEMAVSAPGGIAGGAVRPSVDVAPLANTLIWPNQQSKTLDETVVSEATGNG